MTVYMKTARCFVKAKDYRYLKCPPIEFSIRGWLMVVDAYVGHVPEIKDLLDRVNHSTNQAKLHPTHDRYTYKDEPLRLTWTADECRAMYLAFSRAPFIETENEYDFWEFMNILCRGLSEDGVVAY